MYAYAEPLEQIPLAPRLPSELHDPTCLTIISPLGLALVMSQISEEIVSYYLASSYHVVRFGPHQHENEFLPPRTLVEATASFYTFEN